MAIMVPGLPLDCTNSSGEADLFQCFEEFLPNEVVVCHSVKMKYEETKCPGDIHEGEIDFLVIIPDVGVCALEAKAGQVYPTPKGVKVSESDEDCLWHYANGTLMKHSSPFAQINRAVHLFDHYLSDAANKRKGYAGLSVTTGVCFQHVAESTVKSWNLPMDGNYQTILCKDDFTKEKLYNKIVKIIEFGKGSFRKHWWKDGEEHWEDNYRPLKNSEVKDFIQTIIAPRLNLLPSKNFLVDYQERKMKSFLEDQLVVLDFLDEQNIVTIGGAAGTGKTVVALEKARRLADEGEEVLFLCYNSKLRDYLSSEYPNKHIRYENIDSLYDSYFPTRGDSNRNYSLLVKRLEKESNAGKFPYTNFIVDEAQDYGRKEIEPTGFLLLLQTIAEKNNGCCYFFYDKYQAIQSECKIPEVVQEADCKISLFKNCRNTRHVAETSYKVLSEKERSKRLVSGFFDGTSPLASVCDPADTYTHLCKLVDAMRGKGYKKIVVLTAKTMDTSSLFGFLKTSKSEEINVRGAMIPFTTIRKFKGLEAEAIILVDVTKETFVNPDERFLFYVGSSRAQFDLGLILNIAPKDSKEILEKFAEYKTATIPPSAGLNGILLALGAVKFD